MCSAITFIEPSGTSNFTLQYPEIVVHGISRDTTHFPRPCIYMILSVASNGACLDSHRVHKWTIHLTELATTAPAAASESDDEESDSRITEMRLVPADTGACKLLPEKQCAWTMHLCYFAVDNIYAAIAHCSSLHPDEEQQGDDEDDDAMYGNPYDEDGEDEEAAAGDHDGEPEANGHDRNADAPQFDEHGQLVIYNVADKGPPHYHL